MTVAATLEHAVSEFVRLNVDALRFIASEAGNTVDEPEQLVLQDAYGIACGFVDADGRHTDQEILALVRTFNAHADLFPLAATPADVRASGTLDGSATRLVSDRPLFDLFRDDDRRSGRAHARQYVRSALAIGYAVAALDAMTSPAELQLIERFRTELGGQLGGAAGPARNTPPGEEAPSPGGPAAATGREDALTTSPATEPVDPPRPIEELLTELDELIGLDTVKADVRRLVDLVQVSRLRDAAGLPNGERSLHLVFTGNPGTGKTTVARLIAQLYRSIGVVDRGQLVETDRSGLVAGFVGQTAPLVARRFDEADGGVLFIDEAYSLVRGNDGDFGREAIDTIVKLAEDRRDRVVVVLAGYPAEMTELLDVNPGMRSRFPRTLYFPDYSCDELLRIIEVIAESQGYRLDPTARDAARAILDAAPRARGFGNGRLARNVLEEAIARQASRLVRMESPTRDQLETLTAADIPDAVPGHDVPDPTSSGEPAAPFDLGAPALPTSPDLSGTGESIEQVGSTNPDDDRDSTTAPPSGETGARQ